MSNDSLEIEKYLQQGDVLIIRVGEVPTEAKAVQHDGILAKGEATGHNHKVAVSDMPNTLFYEKGGQLFIKNSNIIKIEHQEHKTIELPVGEWEIKKVKEYDHFLEESRSVRD